MRSRAAAFVAVIAIAAGSVHASPVAPDTTETFVAAVFDSAAAPSPPVSVLPLAKRFLLAGSERVLRGERALTPEVDYRLDAESGAIRLSEPLRPGESLVVSYAYVPTTLPVEIVGLVPLDPTPADSAQAATLTRPPSSTFLPKELEPELSIGGAKTLALEVGTNKDAAVEQSLRVSVAGTIGKNAKITALLSDQNVPLQPEGNTQRLEELDEVLVKIEAPRAGATLGDFLSARHGTPFADYERRLSGAEAHVRVDSAGIRGVGAKARGNFRSAEFHGVEGKQGPYVLAGSGPDPEGVIVAGSERVWFDGILLTRGDANDYVIDYSRGELEFTNRRLVTRDSEIAVDFEIADQEYDRNFTLGEGGGAFFADGLRVRASVTAETDGEDPTNFTLTEDRRNAIRDAGDARVLVPGAVCGVEDGDYDDAGGIFVFAGRDSGSCEVSFTFVGAGLGDYVRDRDLDTGLTFFRFAGAGLGDHTPGLFLPAPRLARLADVGLAGRAGEFGVAADGAYSREDLNRLSSKDDGDNEGGALGLRLGWADADSTRDAPPRPSSDSGALRKGAFATFRGQEAEFVPLGRTREVYLGERWNFVDTTRADEALGEVGGWVESAHRWRAGASAGVLDRAGLFRSRRQEAIGSWAGGRVARATANVQTVQRTDKGDSAGVVHGDLLRVRSDVETRFGRFRPGASYWKEDRTDERDAIRISGQDEEEFGASLGFESSAASARVRASQRTTDVIEAASWARQSVGRTLETEAEARPRQSVRLRASWIRRDLDFNGPRGEDRVTTLTRSDLAHEGIGGLLRGEYVYETTSRTFVDRAASGGGAEEPALAVAASARLRLGGRSSRASGEDAAPAGWRRLLALFESETFARVDEETTDGDRGAIYRLDFSKYQDDSTTVFGKFLLREEVTIFPGETAFSATARWERIDTEDNRLDPERLEIVTERRVLRARNALSQVLTLESQGSIEDESRADSRSGVQDFDLRRSELREELVYQPKPARRFFARGGILSEKNRSVDASIRGISLGGGVSSAIRTTGRIQTEATWTHPTDVRGVDTSSRFRTKDGDQLEWRGLFEIRLSDSISGSFTVTGRALEGAPATHLVRAEARALF